MTPLKGLTLAIQAGGASTRMGQNKALLPFPRRPLIQWILERLSPIAEAVLITTNQPEMFAFLETPCYPDDFPGYGALGGLLTALTHARTPLVAVVACDMPFASLELFQTAWSLLQQHPDAAAVVPRTQYGWEPFHAVYRREVCLPSLRQAIQVGERKVVRWLEAVAPIPLPVEKGAMAFWNVNTPEDYRQALTYLKLREKGGRPP